MENKNAQPTAAPNEPQTSPKGLKIVLKTKSVSHVLLMEEVTHLICDCYLTTVYTTSGQKIVISKLLKEFEEELSCFGFVRVNRNAMVNTQHVACYENGRKRAVVLSNKVSIDISRRGLARLKEAFGQKCSGADHS